MTPSVVNLTVMSPVARSGGQARSKPWSFATRAEPSKTSTTSPVQTRNTVNVSSTTPPDAMRHSHARLFEYEVTAPSVSVPVAAVRSTTVLELQVESPLDGMAVTVLDTVSKTLAATPARPSARNCADVVAA